MVICEVTILPSEKVGSDFVELDFTSSSVFSTSFLTSNFFEEATSTLLSCWFSIELGFAMFSFPLKDSYKPPV